MDEKKFKRTLNDVKWFAIIILILLIIMFFYDIHLDNLNTITITVKTIQFAILLGTIIGCNNRKIYGPICGIIISVLMMLSILALDIIDMILGICLLIECIKLLKYMKK